MNSILVYKDILIFLNFIRIYVRKCHHSATICSEVGKVTLFRFMVLCPYSLFLWQSPSAFIFPLQSRLHISGDVVIILCICFLIDGWPVSWILTRTSDQNGCCLVDCISKWIFLKNNMCIFIEISGRSTGDKECVYTKPLLEPIRTQLTGPNIQIRHQESMLLTRFNFVPSMDK